MSDNTNAAPAGASEQSTTPDDISSMGMDAAVSMWADLDREPEKPAAAEHGEESQSNEETPPGDEPAEEPGEHAEETVDPSEGDQPADTGEPNDDEEPEVVIHGNTMLVLRDGTKIRASDARRAFGELRDIRAQLPELTAAAEEAKQYRAQAAQIAQQGQLYQTLVPLALQKLQAQIPPAPDTALRDSDLFEYLRQKDMHEGAMNELRQFHAGMQQVQAQQNQQQQEAAEAARVRQIEASKSLLQERIPEFADAAKRPAIYKSIVDAVNKYGISQAEVDNNPDARLVHMIYDMSKKVAAYDKLMAQKTTVQQKVVRAAPVAQPGKRVPQAEAAERGQAEKLKAWADNGGNFEEAVRLASQLTKGL